MSTESAVNQGLLVDTLLYLSYRVQRVNSPEVSPERWFAIGIGNAEMEKRYQQELRDANNEQAMKGLDAHFEFQAGCCDES